MFGDLCVEELLWQSAEEVGYLVQLEGREVWLVRLVFNEEMQSLLNAEMFAQALTVLQGAQVDGLGRVLAGQLDPVDNQPAFLLEAGRGEALSEMQERGDGLLASAASYQSSVAHLCAFLPPIVASSISLNGKRILVQQDGEGELVFFFSIDIPLFFKRFLGFTPMEDAASRLESLCHSWQIGSSSRLVVSHSKLQPEIPSIGTGRVPAISEPSVELMPVAAKNKKKNSGGNWGLWVVIGLAVVAIAVGVYLILRVSQNQKQTEFVVDGVEEELGEVGEENLVSDSEVPEVETSSNEEVTPVEEDGESEKEVELAEVVKIDELEIEEEIEVSLSAPTQKSEVLESPAFPQKLAEEETSPIFIFSEEDGSREKLEKAKGKEVELTGVVQRVGQSGGEGKHWYLMMNGTSEEILVVFKHGDDENSGTRKQWELLRDKKIRLNGKAEVFYRGKRDPALRLMTRDRLKILGDIRRHELEDFLGKKSEFIDGMEVEIVGTFSDMAAEGGYGVVRYEESEQVTLRFDLESSLGQNQNFRQKLGRLEGERVVVQGLLTMGDQLAVTPQNSSDVFPE